MILQCQVYQINHPAGRNQDTGGAPGFLLKKEWLILQGRVMIWSVFQTESKWVNFFRSPLRMQQVVERIPRGPETGWICGRPGVCS